MALLNLRGAYFLILIDQVLRKHLCFILIGMVHQFACFCSGLSTVPQVFMCVYSKGNCHFTTSSTLPEMISTRVSICNQLGEVES